MFNYKNRHCEKGSMANRARLVQRQQEVEARVREIEAAATRRAEPPTGPEQWWPELVEEYGGDDEMFEALKVNKVLFNEALVLVENAVQDRRGRRSGIRSNREKLLFLIVYLSQGVRVVELLVAKWIKTRQQVQERAKAIARLFYPHLVGGAVRFFNESVEDAPDAALIVDCTVCQINRPKRPFDEAKIFFSGKHFIYALKKEVCVNVRSGTAAVISKAYPGSVHDLKILRDHAHAINDMLGGKILLADLGYQGARHDVPTIVPCDDSLEQLRTRRVLVECFFGRLKKMWTVFSTRWKLGEEVFDTFFDIACALTNLDILHRPLRQSEAEFNIGILNVILEDMKKAVESQREANGRYVRGRREELGIEGVGLVNQESSLFLICFTGKIIFRRTVAFIDEMIK